MAASARRRSRGASARSRRRAGNGTKSPRRLWFAGALAVAVTAILGAFFWMQANSSEDSARYDALSTLTTADFHSLTISPSDADVLLFGHHAGVLRSTDGGRTWAETNLRSQGQDVMGMAFVSLDGGQLVGAGHDTFYRSADGGQTWDPVTPSLPSTDIHGLAASPGDVTTVYAFVVGHGLYRSRDGGESWERATQQQLPGDIHSMSAGPDGTLYLASSSSGVLRSDDSGQTFIGVAGVTGPMVTAASPSAAGVVYAGTQRELMYSADAGATWVQRELPAPGMPLVISVNPVDAMDVVVVVVGPQGAGEVYRSVDGGKTWGDTAD